MVTAAPTRQSFEREALALKSASAASVVSWGLTNFPNDMCLLSSMQDTVLIDIVMSVDPTLPIVFLDNGFQFDETLEVVARVNQRYGVSVKVVSPNSGAGKEPIGHSCCELKPELLSRALSGQRAWISGLRRAETLQRANADVVEYDHRGLVKLNPLAQWSDRDVETYVESNDLIVHPLRQLGYGSIGCRPCTTSTVGDDLRSGRWPGSDRTECGLHYSSSPNSVKLPERDDR